MSDSCDCGKESKEEDAVVGKTVTAGFIRQVLDMDVFVCCINNDEDLLRRCLAIEDLLECCKYQDDNKEVSTKIDRLFREFTDDASVRFKTPELQSLGGVKK